MPVAPVTVEVGPLLPVNPAAPVEPLFPVLPVSPVPPVAPVILAGMAAAKATKLLSASCQVSFEPLTVLNVRGTLAIIQSNHSQYNHNQNIRYLYLLHRYLARIIK